MAADVVSKGSVFNYMWANFEPCYGNFTTYLFSIKIILTWNEGCWVAEFMAADVASRGSVFNLVISSLAQLARCFLLFTTDSTTPETLSLLSNWWQFSGGGGGPEIWNLVNCIVHSIHFDEICLLNWVDFLGNFEKYIRDRLCKTYVRTSEARGFRKWQFSLTLCRGVVGSKKIQNTLT